MHFESGLLSPEGLLWGKLECNMEEKVSWANLSNLSAFSEFTRLWAAPLS